MKGVDGPGSTTEERRERVEDEKREIMGGHGLRQGGCKLRKRDVESIQEKGERNNVELGSKRITKMLS